MSMTPEEDLKVLEEAASKIKNGVIVETGTCAGESANRMAKASPTSTVHTIDIRSRDPKLEKNVLSYIGDSKEIVKRWKTPIDLLFIDGGHDYETVESDFLGFGRWVRPGSKVFFHDYDSGRNADVTRFINDAIEFYQDFKPLGAMGKMLFAFEAL